MTILQCRACGKRYRIADEAAAKQYRCQACGGALGSEAPAAPVDADVVPAEAAPRRGPRTADEIDYQIFGEEMQYCEITLDPTETVIAEAGAMMYMTDGIQMETVFGDPSQPQQGFWGKVAAAGKRAITGESVFVTTFTNTGPRRAGVAFSSPYPGKILPLHLDQLGDLVPVAALLPPGRPRPGRRPPRRRRQER